MTRFAYYAGLTKAEKAIYRRSDAVAEVPLPDPTPLRRHADQLAEALARDDQIAVEQTAARLASHLMVMLELRPVSVRVFAARPRDAAEELHGMYIREEGRRPVIHLWMRTAARGEVVRFKTFLRTLSHELCHHLDYELLELEDTFHTKGFFRRESHLVKQLAPGGGRARREAEVALAARSCAGRGTVQHRSGVQLELPLEPS